MKRQSIVYKMKILVIGIIPIILAAVCISIYSSGQLMEKIAEQLQQTLNIYTNQRNLQFRNINHSLLNMLLYDDQVQTVQGGGNDLEVINALTGIREGFEELQRSYGAEYTFFMIADERENGRLIEFGEMDYFSYMPNKDKMERMLNNYFKEEEFGKSADVTWELLEEEGTIYIIKGFQYENVILGAVLTKEDMLQPIADIDIGSKGFYFLVDGVLGIIDQKERITDEKITVKNVEKAYLTGIGNQYLLVNSAMESADFDIRIAVTDWGAYAPLSKVQMNLFLLSVLLVLITVFTLYYMITRFIRPVVYFANHLEDFDNYGKGDYEIEEIVKVKEQFRKFVHQIRKLKIEVYEEQLERQKMQLDYYQIQIRPHFFLNFINLFYSMAQAGRTKEITELALEVSDYLRYVFTSGIEQVPLAEELKHVVLYLEIQKKRLYSDIKCSISAAGNSEGYSVPPLLIQTFVENAVKHGLSMKKGLEIEIHVRETEENVKNYVWIIIEDNGKGFSDEVLENLKSGSSLPDYRGRKRVGIRNSIQRMQLLYGKEGSIMFRNGNKGAEVTIIIPKEQMSVAAGQEVRL